TGIGGGAIVTKMPTPACAEAADIDSINSANNSVRINRTRMVIPPAHHPSFARCCSRLRASWIERQDFLLRTFFLNRKSTASPKLDSKIILHHQFASARAPTSQRPDPLPGRTPLY